LVAGEWFNGFGAPMALVVGIGGGRDRHQCRRRSEIRHRGFGWRGECYTLEHYRFDVISTLDIHIDIHIDIDVIATPDVDLDIDFGLDIDVASTLVDDTERRRLLGRTRGAAR
jgi:hypothetical protein